MQQKRGGPSAEKRWGCACKSCVQPYGNMQQTGKLPCGYLCISAHCAPLNNNVVELTSSSACWCDLQAAGSSSLQLHWQYDLYWHCTACKDVAVHCNLAVYCTEHSVIIWPSRTSQNKDAFSGQTQYKWTQQCVPCTDDHVAGFSACLSATCHQTPDTVACQPPLP
jgi:hypothetical protein